MLLEQSDLDAISRGTIPRDTLTPAQSKFLLIEMQDCQIAIK